MTGMLAIAIVRYAFFCADLIYKRGFFGLLLLLVCIFIFLISWVLLSLNISWVLLSLNCDVSHLNLDEHTGILVEVRIFRVLRLLKCLLLIGSV